MNWKDMQTNPAFYCGALCLALLLAPSLLGAQEATGEAREATAETTPTVSAADAQAYLGYWMLTVKLGERPSKFGLLLDEEDGEIDGVLVSGFGEMTAENFAKKDDGALAFDLASSVGRFQVEIQLDGATLLGTFGDTAGSMRAEFTGEKSDRVAFQRFLIPDNETRITRGEDMVRISFVMPPASGRDFEQIEAAKPGEVVRFVEDRAIKLMTDLPLKVGSLEVPTENVAPDYPGVYSLWLKRTAEGWSLVVNEKPDVWGTQHDPSADLGEVPLELSEASEASERLVAELVEAEGGPNTLRITWGPHSWSVPVEVQATAAEASEG